MGFHEELQSLSYNNEKLNNSLLEMNSSNIMNEKQFLECRSQLNQLLDERQDLVCEIGKMRYSSLCQNMKNNITDSSLPRENIYIKLSNSTVEEENEILESSIDNKQSNEN